MVSDSSPQTSHAERRRTRAAIAVLALAASIGLVPIAAAQQPGAGRVAGPAVPKAPSAPAAAPAPRPAAPSVPRATTARRAATVRRATPRRTTRATAPRRTTRTTRRTTATTPRRASGSTSGLGQGARGDTVLALQTRLQELKYDITDADGQFGDQTYHAVMAFQKVNGLSRTGRANAATIAALETATDPEPLIPNGGPDRVEIDLEKQFLALYKGGALVKLLSASSGNGKEFCVFDPNTKKTECDKAFTPGGSYRIRSRIIGWRESKLGLLYNPLYFNGGIAIHGAPSVPATAASHGCVRIPMISAEWFPNEVVDGTPVYVFGGEERPVPLNVKAPSDAKAASTTAPANTLATVPSSRVANPAGATSSTAPSGAPGLPTTTGIAGSVSATTLPTTPPAPTTTGIVRILNPAGAAVPTTTALPSGAVPTTTAVINPAGVPTTTVGGGIVTTLSIPTAAATSTLPPLTTGTTGTSLVVGGVTTTTVAGGATTTTAAGTTATSLVLGR